MNEQFKLVLKYCAINKLSVNLKKTNYMIITSSYKPCGQPLQAWLARHNA